MQSASFRHELFAIWAISLLIFFGNAVCIYISAYSLEDNENRRRYNMEVLVKYYASAWTYQPKLPLHELSSKKSPIKNSNNIISDWVIIQIKYNLTPQSPTY